MNKKNPTKKQRLEKYWKKYTRELVFKKYGKECAICGSQQIIQVHHILGRNGLDGFLHISEDVNIPLCASCHWMEKQGTPENKVYVLSEAFKKAGGIIEDDIWRIKTSLGWVMAVSIKKIGHNSPRIYLNNQVNTKSIVENMLIEGGF